MFLGVSVWRGFGECMWRGHARRTLASTARSWSSSIQSRRRLRDRSLRARASRRAADRLPPPPPPEAVDASSGRDALLPLLPPPPLVSPLASLEAGARAERGAPPLSTISFIWEGEKRLVVLVV